MLPVKFRRMLTLPNLLHSCTFQCKASLYLDEFDGVLQKSVVTLKKTRYPLSAMTPKTALIFHGIRLCYLRIKLEARASLISEVTKQTSSRELMPLFEKILVPLDGSEHSMHALEKAVQIAKKFDGKVALIHVYSVVHPVSVSPLTMTETGILAPELVTKLAEASRKAGARILSDGGKRAKAEKVHVETLLREGNVIEEILKTCREGEFDLIVIGARGLSRIKEIFLGGVSHGVTIHAPCPVLVVK